jgi:hypothetical protein
VQVYLQSQLVALHAFVCVCEFRAVTHTHTAAYDADDFTPSVLRTAGSSPASAALSQLQLIYIGAGFGGGALVVVCACIGLVCLLRRRRCVRAYDFDDGDVLCVRSRRMPDRGVSLYDLTPPRCVCVCVCVCVLCIVRMYCAALVTHTSYVSRDTRTHAQQRIGGVRLHERRGALARAVAHRERAEVKIRGAVETGV